MDAPARKRYDTRHISGFSDELWQQCEAAAKAAGRTTSWFVLEAVREKLGRGLPDTAKLEAALQQMRNTAMIPLPPATVTFTAGEPPPTHTVNTTPSVELSACCGTPLFESEEGDCLVTRCAKCRGYISMRGKE